MTKGTIIRLAVLTFALANQVMIMIGKSPLPIEDEQIEILVSTAWTVVAAIVAAWKNNSVTHAAIMADEYLKEVRKGA